jgi:hypothetical protein
MLSEQLEKEIMGFPTAMAPINVSTNDSPPIDLLSTANLKKKDVETKTSRRRRTWLDKRRKIAKKGGEKKENGSKVCDNTKYI